MRRQKVSGYLASLALAFSPACALPTAAPVLTPSFIPETVTILSAAGPVVSAQVTLGVTNYLTDRLGRTVLAVRDPAAENVVQVSADGFATQRVTLPFCATFCEQPAITLGPAHVDPSTVSLKDLARIRGAMWTARWDGPYGPRPGQPDNILAMAFYSSYGVDDRAKMLAIYKSKGYTHAVTGAPAGGDCYHGQYPCRTSVPTQAEWDAYLDSLQEWWDAGIMPVFFAHPDNWSLADMAQLDVLFAQPRAQRLLRIVVYTGWEPWRYDLTNAQWNEWFKHAIDVFPNALHLVHTVNDADALTGPGDGSAGGDDPTVNGEGNAGAWRRSAPLLHGWLIQLSACGQPEPLGQPLQNVKAYFADMVRRFHQGYAGWPTGSLWGPDKPLLIIHGEDCAYDSYWHDLPEKVSVAFGDAAMEAGADGYLDAGSAEVPVPASALR